MHNGQSGGIKIPLRDTARTAGNQGEDPNRLSVERNGAEFHFSAGGTAKGRAGRERRGAGGGEGGPGGGQGRRKEEGDYEGETTPFSFFFSLSSPLFFLSSSGQRDCEPNRKEK